MKRLLAIFAHPDDEGVIGGALAHYAQRGVETMLVCATRGEAGEVSDPALTTDESLAVVRERELREACRILGIRELRFLGYRDSGMDGTPDNEDPRSLAQADSEEVIVRLASLMEELQPGAVVTFEPFGWYGHPDHMAVGRLATEAYDRVSGENAVSGNGQVWRPRQLYHALLPVSIFEGMLEYAKEYGFADEIGVHLLDERRETDVHATHVLDMRPLIDQKLNAMWAHHTQFGADHWFRKMPKEVLRDLWGVEYFEQVRPKPNRELFLHPANELQI